MTAAIFLVRARTSSSLATTEFHRAIIAARLEIFSTLWSPKWLSAVKKMVITDCKARMRMPERTLPTLLRRFHWRRRIHRASQPVLLQFINLDFRNSRHEWAALPLTGACA